MKRLPRRVFLRLMLIARSVLISVDKFLINIRVSLIYAMAQHVYGADGIGEVSTFLFHQNKRRTQHILRRFHATIGNNSDVLPPLTIHNADRDYSALAIGNNCHVGKGVLLDLRDRIVVGDNVTISMKCTLLTHLIVGHSPLKHSYPFDRKPLYIENGVYLGANATILHGVRIGENSFIAAGAVVTKDIPPCSLAAGVPARVVRHIELKTADPVSQTAISSSRH